MGHSYNKIICIHPKDPSTQFLTILGRYFGENYLLIEDNDDAHKSIVDLISSNKSKSLLIFLGHGFSTALYTAETKDYPKKVFIDSGNSHIFEGHDVFILACRSEEFITKIPRRFNSAIGFGNIISSRSEISQEAELTSNFRNLDDSEIAHFNSIYMEAIRKSFELLFKRIIIFHQMSDFISYFLNKNLNSILRSRDIKNRIEVAKLVCEFRNEMRIINN